MLKTTKAQVEGFIRDLQENDRIIGNEKVWNFLVGHLLAHGKYKEEHFATLIGGQKNTNSSSRIWYEAEPLSPRKGEGNTKLDLALGYIKSRGKTQLGIEFDYTKEGNSWVCFVEGKYSSDCSTTVRYDPLRNQLARVIENLIVFEGNGHYPENLIFTLLTPRVFRTNPHSRLYGYKMDEYRNSDSVLRDIEQSCLEKRYDLRDSEEFLQERLTRLKLNWVCYEDILEREFGFRFLDLTSKNWEEPESEKMLEFIRALAEQYHSGRFSYG